MKNIRMHPEDTELADYLDNALSPEDRDRIERHIAECRECLDKIVSAHESVRRSKISGKTGVFKKFNIYLVLTILSFLLSFIMPRYFLQFLLATLLLGTKWIVDSKTTKMLITIYEAWKSGGENDSSPISKDSHSHSKKLF